MSRCAKPGLPEPTIRGVGTPRCNIAALSDLMLERGAPSRRAWTSGERMSSQSSAVTAAPVIRARIAVPPLPEPRVDRPRVTTMLADLIGRHQLVVVAAAAGAGKTTAVASTAATLDRPAAWITLDWTEAAPGRLITYLESALAVPLPALRGVATGALAQRLPHTEAAGLLAEAVGEAEPIVVLDEVERLSDSEQAHAVLEAFLRYAPPSLRTVLISRRDIPPAIVPRTFGPGDRAVLGDSALAFTPDEARAALMQLGAGGIDPAAAVEATGGWVTGVLFEAWRSGEYVASGGGDADPLHGYLSAQILAPISEPDRDFLVMTSLLDEVSVDRAIALGHADAAERIASIRAEHLPIGWDREQGTLRYHTRFREYLTDELERRGADAVRGVRRAHGRLLIAEGRDEEAAEELLAAGAHAQARECIERAIFGLIDRLDFDVAERWLDALAEPGPLRPGPLVVAELTLALAKEEFGRGAALGDELAATGARADLAANSTGTAWLMGFCYMHLGRLDDVHAVFDEAGPGPDSDVARYWLAFLGPDAPPPRPALTGSPLDVMVLALDHGYGRLGSDDPSVGWIDAFTSPWRIASLASSGRTRQALDVYEEVRARGVMTAALETSVGPNVLVDAGRRDEALAAIERGRRLARRGESLVFELFAGIAEARLALRIDRDPAAARAALDRVEQRPRARTLAYAAEHIDTWYGFALLLEDDEAGARERLGEAVGSMRRSHRMLELPTAAVYLAEAEWRAGNEEASDRAADVALEAARHQGSNHMLLRALADFPAVVSRRIDVEAAADSPWHSLGRALAADGIPLDATVAAAVEVVEFGARRIFVGGDEVRPRIVKSYELLAYLASRRGASADRDALLAALFEGRADDSTRAYLRQAIRWVRQVLPEGAIETAEGSVRIGDAVTLRCESVRFEAALAEAMRQQGNDKLRGMLAALELFDRGPYLPGLASTWIEDRRRDLTELAGDARYEAAEVAFAADRLDLAEQLVNLALSIDQYREPAWRLAMRVESALGREHRVVRAYQRCEQRLAEIGATPSATTRDLLERLRR